MMRDEQPPERIVYDPEHGWPKGSGLEGAPPPPPPPGRDGFEFYWRWTDLIPLGLVGVVISALMAVLHSCAGA